MNWPKEFESVIAEAQFEQSEVRVYTVSGGVFRGIPFQADLGPHVDDNSSVSIFVNALSMQPDVDPDIPVHVALKYVVAITHVVSDRK